MDILIRTMVKEMKNQLIKTNLPWTIKFAVEPNQNTIYDEFCKQVLTIHEGIFKICFSFTITISLSYYN